MHVRFNSRHDKSSSEFKLTVVYFSNTMRSRDGRNGGDAAAPRVTSGTTVAAGDSRGGGGRRLEGAGSRRSTSTEVTLPTIHHRALSSLLAGTEGVVHATHTGPVI